MAMELLYRLVLPTSLYERYLNLIKKAVVVLVMMMILAAIVITIIATGYQLYHDMGDNTPILEKREILDLFSYILLIVIGLELLDTIYGLITDSKIHVEIVLLIAITAVARELIVTDYNSSDGLFLMGIGVVLAGVAVAYYLIKKVERFKLYRVSGH
jgi:uncharacterized membrane protein (DUF373 family)